MDPLILLAVIAALALAPMAIRIVPQGRADVVDRLGRYHRVLMPGLNVVLPLMDQVRAKVDMREQVLDTAPHPVITADNLMIQVDTVLYYRVLDPRAATYEISDVRGALQQLTVTVLRNVIGAMDVTTTLSSRDEINRAVQAGTDQNTGQWGVKVTRVEIKKLEPPPSFREPLRHRNSQLEQDLADRRRAVDEATDGSDITG